ncbi:hypothetical protein JZ751_028625 [Albula glossodonta]|uniref:Uncharacterized protein n=1 Tax=Albula glossodonta TaxID=121402 RepID=A0A8T2NB06_9TELE|nr:hypothetical protein JZ751_028625 [Albula glossodonta]
MCVHAQVQEPTTDRQLIETSPVLQKLTDFEEAIGVLFTHVRLLARAFTLRTCLRLSAPYRHGHTATCLTCQALPMPILPALNSQPHQPHLCSVSNYTNHTCPQPPATPTTPVLKPVLTHSTCPQALPMPISPTPESHPSHLSSNPAYSHHPPTPKPHPPSITLTLHPTLAGSCPTPFQSNTSTNAVPGTAGEESNFTSPELVGKVSPGRCLAGLLIGWAPMLSGRVTPLPSCPTVKSQEVWKRSRFTIWEPRSLQQRLPHQESVASEVSLRRILRGQSAWTVEACSVLLRVSHGPNESWVCLEVSHGFRCCPPMLGENPQPPPHLPTQLTHTVYLHSMEYRDLRAHGGNYFYEVESLTHSECVLACERERERKRDMGDTTSEWSSWETP